MKLLLLFIFVLIVILIYLLLKNTSKNLILTAVLSAMIFYIVLNPKSCMTFTIDGTKLFFYSVFPSLFPFLVIINLIFAFGGIEIYSKFLGKIICTPLRLPKECSVVLLASLFCGYPLGARYASELYELKIIDKNTFERLLNIASNGSPLFIIGTVGTSMLHSTFLGYLLIISNILSCIIMGLILPSKKMHTHCISPSSSVAVTKINSAKSNLGTTLKNSLEDATKTCLSIGSFVIIFSVLINIIKSSGLYHTALTLLCTSGLITYDLLDSLLLGFIEVTNGCNIAATSTISINSKLILCSFLIGFSGLSITSQVYSFVSKYKISMKKYLSLKIIQGVICAFITFLFLKFPLTMFHQETFLSKPSILSSKTGLLSIITFIFILPVVLKKLKDYF